jgi:hypothetical protein
MQEENRLAMGADLGLARPENPRAPGLKLVARLARMSSTS